MPSADTTPHIAIRPAVPADAALVLRFIRELAEYEKAAGEVVATEDAIRATLCSGEGPARALVCRAGGEPAGFAAYFFNYSTWQGRKGLYLEDLYVTPSQRHHGAGKALLRHLARIAVAEGCGRFEWSVLDWNEPALQFYRSIGAWPMDEWVRYRLAGDALAAFAQDR
jgi:GNAT superfamily N-acetyltransferase